MIQFDPSNVPVLTADFLKKQIASAPPGMQVKALYLGRRQLDEIDDLDLLTVSAHTPPVSHLLRGVEVHQVAASSHFLLTFIETPSTEKLLGDLLDYCLKLDTSQNCPPEFLDIVVLADRVKMALDKEGI